MSVRAPEILSQPRVAVIADRCAGCQECVIRCPVEALSMDSATWTAVANSDACVGCRQCVRTCPFGAITVDGPLLVSDRVDPFPRHPAELRGNIDETRVGYASWDEALAEANRCLECPDPTCMRGCPAHNDIPGFIAAIRDRDLTRAHEILRRTTFLPDICSRVCNQSAQCEGACTWSLAGGEPVAIGRLERFVSDNAPVPAPSVRVDHSPEAPLSVGIIGSGPAGVGAAWELLEAGAEVTVYEKDATPGGLCVWGMPDFTLPDDVARRPWHQLTQAGVELHCDIEVHPEDVPQLLQKHDAVVVANGAGVAMRLSVPGAQLDGVVDATMFLQGAKSALELDGDAPAFLSLLGLADVARTQAHVLVLGAGNTAMDVARTARRLGLDATCVDWVNERFALARPDELAEARHEGVDVRFECTLVSLAGEAGRIAQAILARTVQKEATQPPRVLDGGHDVINVDLVVMAMGYRTDASFASVAPGTPVRKTVPAIADRRWAASGIMANPASSYAHCSPVGKLALARESSLWASAMATSERLWVAGDALTGPATVVEAMAQGRRAAAAILDAGPARPGRTKEERSSHVPRVLVCYASRGGTTAGVAQIISESFNARGFAVTTLPIEKVGVQELLRADVLIIGTWVEGLVVTRVHPALAMRKWLAALPTLAGRPVGIFCTYGVNPKDSLDEVRVCIESHGGKVIRDARFGPPDLRGDAVTGPTTFANNLIAELRNEMTVTVAAR